MANARLARLLFTVIGVGIAGVILYHMYFSLTPATHADHDHGLASIDAGGFLRLEQSSGRARNFAGKPGKVLVLHWFTLDRPGLEEEAPAIADFIEEARRSPDLELALVAVEPDWAPVRAWARARGIAEDVLYLDRDMRTGKIFGVRRLPETLAYDPNGRLAYQARGTIDWRSPQLRAAFRGFMAGVDEIE